MNYRTAGDRKGRGFEAPAYPPALRVRGAGVPNGLRPAASGRNGVLLRSSERISRPFDGKADGNQRVERQIRDNA